jgi:hypothetical protein
MKMNNWMKIPYEMGKKAVGAVRKMNVKGTANTAMNVGTGVAAGSMLPMSAGPSADKDIARMKQYQPKR